MLKTLVAGKNVDRSIRIIGFETGIPLRGGWRELRPRSVFIDRFIRGQRIVNGDGQEYEQPDNHENDDTLYFSEASGSAVFQFAMDNLNKLI